MKNYSFYVGIDISKLTLDVAIIEGSTAEKLTHFVVANSVAGLKEMSVRLNTIGIDAQKALFCCENTGIYTYPLSIFLSEKGFHYWIVPAVEIKRSKGITRGKTNKTDAYDIALYSLRNIDKLSLSTLAEKQIQVLKLMDTERQKILKALLLFGSTSEGKAFIVKEVYKSIDAINLKTIRYLEKSLKAIETKIRETINSDPTLKSQLKLATSIPGVGERTAIHMIIATKGFTAFKSWRKFACYSGVAPFEYSSGSSVRGKTKVNHMADKKMKSLLHMAAMAALRHDSQIREYYLKKRAQGKCTMLIINNVRCKLIARIFAVVNRQSPFINTFKFST